MTSIADCKISINSCSLCGGSLPPAPLREEESAFCCHGCQAVFKILSKKGELTGFQEHPLFLQAVKSGLISNPELLDRIRSKQAHLPEYEWQKIYLEIQEMWCPSCSEIIRLVLLQEKGVKECAVDYTTDLAWIEFAPQLISRQSLLQIIASLGYRPQDIQDSKQKAVSFSLYLRFIIASFASLNVMMLAYPLYAAYFKGNEHEYGRLFAWLSFFLSLPVISYSAYPILQRFYHGLSLGFLGMEMLVVIGVSSAFGLSVHELFSGGTHVYFDSMTVIIAFVLLGKIIETRAKFSTKDALMRLSLALPRRGRKRNSSGKTLFVPIKEIDKGDHLVVMSGEKIVLDGVVIEGEGTADESLMTGESMPVQKKKDDLVIGGTFLSQGFLVISVTHDPSETALQKILDVVSQDIGHKSAYLRAVDPIVRWFVPLIVLLAIGVGFATDFERAITVLLISCPCAIGIAVPLAEAGMIHAMAALGAIVRSRGSLAFIGQETCFIFDKTGTLTEGRFLVQEGLEKISNEDIQVLKGVTALSNHLLSSAIHRSIGVEGKEISNFEEIPGRGLTAQAGGCRFLLGSLEFLRKEGIAVNDPPLSDEVKTCVGFAKEGELLSLIILGDALRKDAPSVAMAIDAERILLSGDGQEAVLPVARRCGFDEWHASMRPLEKRAFVEKKKQEGGIVAMLGDGINDAAALASAHVGISVVTAADISVQVSDILLTTDRLSAILDLRQVARKGRRIIKQNLFWAFFYNVIGIGLAVFGCLNPLLSAAAMVLSSTIIIFNANRLKKS